MTDSEAPATEPLFRANKRRKVFRRRDDGDTASDAPTVRQGAVGAGADQEEAVGPRHIQRKPVVRKRGIGFTSTGRSQTQPAPQELEENEETAMMLVHPSREQNVLSTVSSERFMKPTGKAAVVDDKHMMAFVDTKMAEMRSANSTPKNYTLGTTDSQLNSTPTAQDELDTTDMDVQPTLPTLPNQTLPAAARSRQPKRQPTRPRRPPPKRDESRTARDSLVDQIMQESSIPLYDKSSTSTRYLASGGGDNDAAAMEAFKADFLADSEQHKKRKQPAPPAGTKGAVATSHGPKLGGSRTQRARMKAAAAAAAAVGETLSKK
ncbi:hypothetical protein LTR08_000817 [Meristemomyces frigidus]|nr:hypothetical protein LTR08_000817 [Meristemomyces frigidus]